MRRVIFALLTVVFAFEVSFEAKAWGGFGHHVASYIADQNLTTTAKKEIRKYLPHTLTYYASWMDNYRTTVPYEPLDWWHNVAVDKDNNIVELDGRSGYVQSKRIIKEMKDYKNLPDSLVALNIKILVHVIVDLHCPSHNRYLAPPFDWQNPQFENGYSQIMRFRFKGKRMSYHSFWDRSPALFHKGWNCENFNQELNVLSKSEIKKVCKGTLEDWVAQCVRDNRLPFKYIVPNEEFTELPQEQQDEMVALVDRQLQLAGYRLAYVLNNIFDAQTNKSKK